MPSRVLEYLTTMTDPKLRQSLTMYRLSEHSLAIERGHHRQTRLSRDDRLCVHCPQNELDTERYFLTSCPMYEHIRDTYFPQITQTNKEFENKSNIDKLTYSNFFFISLSHSLSIQRTLLALETHVYLAKANGIDNKQKVSCN